MLPRLRSPKLVVRSAASSEVVPTVSEGRRLGDLSKKPRRRGLVLPTSLRTGRGIQQWMAARPSGDEADEPLDPAHSPRCPLLR